MKKRRNNNHSHSLYKTVVLFYFTLFYIRFRSAASINVAYSISIIVPREHPLTCIYFSYIASVMRQSIEFVVLYK